LDTENDGVRDCCLFPRIPRTKDYFSVSDDSVKSSAIVCATTAEMSHFIAGQPERWLETWAAEANAALLHKMLSRRKL